MQDAIKPQSYLGMSCPKIGVIKNQFFVIRIYSLELRDQLCKEHINNGIKLADLARKYNLTCHCLIHNWLRKLGYLPGYNRRTGVKYICSENETDLKKKTQSKNAHLTKEQRLIAALKKELGERYSDNFLNGK